MRSRLAVAAVVLVSLSSFACFLFPALLREHRVSSDGSDYAIERITQSRFGDMTGWSLSIKERLVNLLGFQPNSDGTLLLYQTGVNGSEVRLFDTGTQEDRLVYQPQVVDPHMVFEFHCSAFWLGTYDGVIITEHGGYIAGPYRIFHYDLGSRVLAELPPSLFIHPELNLNMEGVLGSPPGTRLLVVQSAVDSQADGLHLYTLSGERVAEMYSGRRGTFGFRGISERGTVLWVTHGGVLNDFGETETSIYLYGLETRTVDSVPTDGLTFMPMFRPGANTLTFVERDPQSLALYLREYAIDGTERVSTLLKLADGGGDYCWASYCWSIDGRRLYVIDP